MNTYKIEEIRAALKRNNLLFPLDVALVGATGVGKSSTINALFGSEVAKVGRGNTPETQNVTQYKINNVLRLHDTAGFGDGQEADLRHAKNLTDLLLKSCTERDGDPNQKFRFIDLALVILDGSSRDLGTTFKLLNDIVMRLLPAKRVIVAINKADLAMKGRNWDYKNNKPNNELLSFLEEQSKSIKSRITDSSGVYINKPIFYSAECQYQLDALIKHIISHIPNTRMKIE